MRQTLSGVSKACFLVCYRALAKNFAKELICQLERVVNRVMHTHGLLLELALRHTLERAPAALENLADESNVRTVALWRGTVAKPELYHVRAAPDES